MSGKGQILQIGMERCSQSLAKIPSNTCAGLATLLADARRWTLPPSPSVPTPFCQTDPIQSVFCIYPAPYTIRRQGFRSSRFNAER
ncbi:hypothetical protein V6N13_118935 [Hibiscus sabdariffa]